jgi:hypothetical protein
MTVESNKTAAKQILNIVIVLALGVGCAFVLAMGTLYYFGPTGSYKAGNALLSLDVSSQLSDYEAKVEFLYYEDKTKEWRRVKVDKENYQKFYHFIAEESSIVPIPEHIIAMFNNSNPAILTVFMKKEGENQQEEDARFQEVQILRFDDFYRIQIHDEHEGQNWAYFFHENIYDESKQLLLSEDGK